MIQYNYHRAESVADVCGQLALHREKIRILAGGTDLLVQIRENDKKWRGLDYVLDISGLRGELSYIREEDNLIKIGALSTHTDLECSPIIQKFLPFLGIACSTVGSPQIRNMGTIGGSICNGSPAADPLTPLIAADAKAVIQGREGTREILLKDFYLGKGDVDLKEGEFLSEFVVEKLPKAACTAFAKLGRRKALAISRLNAAIVLSVEEGVITMARIAPGCIFVRPDRVTEAEKALTGEKPSREVFALAGKKVSEEMIKRTGVRWSTEYKQPAVEGIVEQGLLMAAGMEERG